MNLVISRAIENRSVFRPAYKILAALTHTEPLDFDVVTDANRRITDEMRNETINLWTNWYAGQFKQAFAPSFARGTADKLYALDHGIHELPALDEAPYCPVDLLELIRAGDGHCAVRLEYYGLDVF